MASSSTMTVLTRTIQNELTNASWNESRPVVDSVTSLYRSSVGLNRSFGLVLASCSSLKLLSTVQKTGKKNSNAASQATMPSTVLVVRLSPTPSSDPRLAIRRSPHP